MSIDGWSTRTGSKLTVLNKRLIICNLTARQTRYFEHVCSSAVHCCWLCSWVLHVFTVMADVWIWDCSAACGCITSTVSGPIHTYHAVPLPFTLATAIWDWYASDNKLPGTGCGSSKGHTLESREHAGNMPSPCHCLERSLTERHISGMAWERHGNGMALWIKHGRTM
jgi:hypothetical protein